MTNPTGTIYGTFLAQVRDHPDAPAATDQSARLTYLELAQMAAAVRDALPDGPSCIGVVMAHGCPQIASMLAVLSVGSAYVPAEPDFPVERIASMMDQSSVSVVLTQHGCEQGLGNLPLIYVDDLLVNQPLGDATPIDELPADLSSPESLAYVLYTSGSTGKPKGVMVENRNVCHYARAFEHEFHVGPGDVTLQYSVCSFDIFVEEVFATLLNGGAVAIAPQDARDDLAALMAYVQDQGVTVISGFPYLLADINAAGNLPACVRLLISGGDVLHARFVDKLLDQAEVYNTYGPSETTVCCSYFRCNGAQPLEDGTYPIGKAVLGNKVLVLDDELHTVERGRTGELCILGGGISRGYSDPALDAPFGHMPNGERVYRSGDLGYELPSGDLAFLHRKDTQVMILGKRVEAEEVEAVLNLCDHVKEGVVQPHTDERGFSYLTAYVVPADDLLTLGGLRSEMARHLAPFMIPEFFVRMEEIPLNANGKPDRASLPVVMKAGVY